VKGVDTNVVLRLLLDDDPGQSARAKDAVRRESAAGMCRVSHIVLCEVVWVLQSGYRYARKEVDDAVHALLLSDHVEVEEPDVARSALYAFRTSRADFADCLIGMANGFRGCERTLTFDRRAAELAEFELI
jgi:predicted nucleic-acid-binding protein